MRWSIIRIIWLRELRDQLRDRRTVFMIAVLPVLLYPLAGLGMMQVLAGILSQKHVVGVAGADHLVPWTLNDAERSPAGAAGWLSFSPPPPGVALGGLARLSGAAAFDLGRRQFDYPPLLEARSGGLVFAPRYADSAGPALLELKRLEGPVTDSPETDELAAPLRKALDDRRIDLLLLIPRDVQQALRDGGQPRLTVLGRPNDDGALRVNSRLTSILSRWGRDLKVARFTRLGHPEDFDRVIYIDDPQRAKPQARLASETIFSLTARVFPFVLVLWALAGALYPAVDLCAGEKERGTMETLLISPASREELVWGKFLTIWLFSGATAFLNLLSMALTTAYLAAQQSSLPGSGMRLSILVWGFLLLLPLSAFFSAVCLAVGAYARSSKEGQYYLMPLFLLTLPLIAVTFLPSVELNPFYSMVPVTGVALLLQRLVATEGPDRGVWAYFVPVLAPMVIYSWLALRWAIEQFQREEVLFREAERLDIGLWFKRLLREKEALPSAGEAFFCFGLILGLRWLSFGVGQHLSLWTRTGVGQVAFVATPPLFMAMLLTTKPRRGLGATLPPWWAWPLAVALALLVQPPIAELTLAILNQFPALKALLEINHPLTLELQALSEFRLSHFFVLAVLPAVCEELAFRGFILRGLLRGFRPWTAILLSAFLFAAYQMNVFQFVPHFVFGVVLGLIAVRADSVLPAMLFHLVYNSTLILLSVAFGSAGLARPAEGMPGEMVWRVSLSLTCTLLAAAGLAAVWRLGRRPRGEASA